MLKVNCRFVGYMKISEVKNYLKQKKLFMDCKVRILGRGSNYQVFLIDDATGQFVLRVGRDDVAICNKLENEFHILEFLETQNIDFVARPILWDKKKRISILTFIPGEEKSVSKLTPKRLDLFVRQLIELHSLKLSSYKRFCKKKNINFEQVETPMDAIHQYGIARFDYIKKNCDDRKLVDWIEVRLKANVENIRKTKWTQKQIIFNHNDLAGANIIVDKNNIRFIDWEHARFLYSTTFGLRHIFNHDDGMTRGKREKLIYLYAKYSSKGVREIKRAIQDNFRVSKLNDIIWAVMTYTEMRQKGMRGAEQYMEMAEVRIGEWKKESRKSVKS